MYIKPTEEQIKNGMEWGWSKEQCERGYDIFDYDGTGMLNIEAIGDVYCSTDDQEGYNDEECAKEAVRTGFCKIIPVDELPKNFAHRYYVWVDTPENRKAIDKYCNVKYGIKISYSWGDEEEDTYGSYDTKEDAFKSACMYAAKEAYVQNEEFLPEHDKCIVEFNASKYEINLYYAYDNSYCYYRIKELED